MREILSQMIELREKLALSAAAELQKPEPNLVRATALCGRVVATDRAIAMERRWYGPVVA